MEVCLHQFIRPSGTFLMPNVGDCTKCIADKKNRECLQFTPINVFTFEVKDGDSSQAEM